MSDNANPKTDANHNREELLKNLRERGAAVEEKTTNAVSVIHRNNALIFGNDSFRSLATEDDESSRFVGEGVKLNHVSGVWSGRRDSIEYTNQKFICCGNTF